MYNNLYLKREERFSEKNTQKNLESWQFYKFVHKTEMFRFFLLAQKFLRFDRNETS